MKSFGSVILLAATVGGCLALPGCYNDATDFERLSRSAASIDGAVVYLECNQHDTFVYSFVVAGHEHRTRTRSTRCSAMKLGDKVAVYYDPDHPETNTVLPPNDAYEKARGWYVPSWMFPLIILPIMVVVGIVMQVRSGRGR